MIFQGPFQVGLIYDSMNGTQNFPLIFLNSERRGSTGEYRPSFGETSLQLAFRQSWPQTSGSQIYQ